MNLDDLVSGLVKDVKSGKAKRQAAKERKEKKLREKIDRNAPYRDPAVGDDELILPALPPIPNSRWKTECLVVYVNRVRCDCGSVHESPAPGIFLKRVAHTPGGPLTETLRLTATQANAAYSHLDRKIEYGDQRTCACPDCFIEDTWVKDFQLNLPLDAADQGIIPLQFEEQV